jgi:hypothetical protein
MSCKIDPYWVEGWKSYSINQSKEILTNKNEASFFNKLTIRSDSVFASRLDQEDFDSLLPFNILPNTKQVASDFRRGKLSVLPVANGYLLGIDRGEWEGNLYWFSKDGKYNYKISNHQIVQFITQKGNIYAIEGLTHFNYFISGSIIKIERVSGKWNAFKYLTLNSTPRSVANDHQGNFIVACTNNLLRIRPNRKVDTLVKKAMWNQFYYPTSLVVKNNIAYIGMLQCVFRYNLNTQKQDLLADKDLDFYK